MTPARLVVFISMKLLGLTLIRLTVCGQEVNTEYISKDVELDLHPVPVWWMLEGRLSAQTTYILRSSAASTAHCLSPESRTASMVLYT
jgi:hypothetical protein